LVCIGSGLIVESAPLEAADAHHGGDSCVFREFLGSRQNLIAVNLLNDEGYFQSQIVPGFWKHKTKPIQFVLVVDNFGIKYLKREDLDHLIRSLENY